MTSSVPVTQDGFASRRADEAWDALTRLYTRSRPQPGSPDASMRYETVSTPQVATDRVQLWTAHGAFDANPAQLTVISVLAGSIGLDFGRAGSVTSRAGDSYVYLPHSPADLTWDTFGALALRLPMDLVARRAHELTDLPPGSLRFESPRPLSDAHSRLWRDTAETVWRQLSATDHLEPLVHHEMLTLTCAAALWAFPTTAMTRGYVPGPGDVRPAAVRRATAYIDAHLSLPITLTDIAEAAGTTPTALRAGFRRHLNTTPTGYLRRTRLEAARRELEALDPATVDVRTVRTTAARWGFRSVARFEAAYLAAFGTAPRTGSPHRPTYDRPGTRRVLDGLRPTEAD